MLPVKRVKYKCPHCAKHLVCPASYSKRQVQCSRCGGAFRLPDFEKAYEEHVSTWLDDRPAIVDNQQRHEDEDDDFDPVAAVQDDEEDAPSADDPIESMMESEEDPAASSGLSLNEICPDVSLFQECDDESLDEVDLSSVEKALEESGIDLEDLDRQARKRQKRLAKRRKLKQLADRKAAQAAARRKPEPDDPIESMLESDDEESVDTGSLSLDDICPDVSLFQECDDESLDEVDLSAVEKALEKSGIKLEDVAKKKKSSDP